MFCRKFFLLCAFNFDNAKILSSGIYNYIENLLFKQCSVVDCMLFNAFFNLFSVILQPPVHLSMLTPSPFYSSLQNILSKPLAAFQPSHCRNNGQHCDRVTMIIIDSPKEYCPSLGWNQQPPVLKSCMSLTELFRLAVDRLRNRRLKKAVWCLTFYKI